MLIFSAKLNVRALCDVDLLSSPGPKQHFKELQFSEAVVRYSFPSVTHIPKAASHSWPVSCFGRAAGSSVAQSHLDGIQGSRGSVTQTFCPYFFCCPLAFLKGVLNIIWADSWIERPGSHAVTKLACKTRKLEKPKLRCWIMDVKEPCDWNNNAFN